MKIRNFVLTSAALTATALAPIAATAGSADVAVVEAAPAAPVVVAPVAPMGNWTGAYGGLSLGAQMSESGSYDDTQAVYGVFGGYDYQVGRAVFGGELEFSGSDEVDLNGVDVENVARAKIRGGWDFGQTLVYATAGMSKVETNIGDATSPVGGFGMEYKVTDRFGLGAEYLAENFEDIGSTNVDVVNQTINLRGTLRF